MPSFKLYDALEIPRGSSKEEIKRAYRKLAIDHHPDKGGDGEKFKEISHAYQVLNDDEKKRMYDQLGDEGFERSGAGAGGGHPFDPSSIFEELFGGRGGHPFFGGNPFGGFHEQPQGQRRCRNVHNVIQMTNRDAFFGGQKTIKVTLHKKCFQCVETCYTCQGRGQITEMQRMGPFTTMANRPCNTCRGSGTCVKGKSGCGECKGKGDYVEEKKIELTIPAGIDNGNCITIAGCGEQPQQSGDIAGDLVFEINIQPDGSFERNGLDLTYRTQITLVESLVGKEIEIPLYDGAMKINISQFGIIQPNKSYTIPNKGMIKEKSRGSLHVIFQIRYPSKHPDEEAKKELSELFARHGL